MMFGLLKILFLEFLLILSLNFGTKITYFASFASFASKNFGANIQTYPEKYEFSYQNQNFLPDFRREKFKLI